MNLLKRFMFVFVAGFCLLSYTAPAKAFLILNDMVFIGENAGAASFKIKNVSEDPEAYRLDWTQLYMKEHGPKEKIPDGQAVPGVMAADSYMYVAPRRLLLMPNQVQHVRFMVRKQQNMPAGEYRSYIVFQPEVVPDNFNPDDPSGQQQVAPGRAGAQISMMTGYRIPVFFLNGDTTLNISASNARLGTNEKGKPTIYFTFHREGTRSAIGDVNINCMVDGMPVLLSKGQVKVFTELSKRDLHFFLKPIPQGCQTINVDYMPHAQDPDFNGGFTRLVELSLQ